MNQETRELITDQETPEDPTTESRGLIHFLNSDNNTDEAEKSLLHVRRLNELSRVLQLQIQKCWLNPKKKEDRCEEEGDEELFFLSCSEKTPLEYRIARQIGAGIILSYNVQIGHPRKLTFF